MHAVIDPTAAADVRLRPVDAAGVVIGRGFWADRLATNEVSLRHALGELVRAGNVAYLEAAAAREPTPPNIPSLQHGLVSDNIFDSDVYKWLEAVAWASTTSVSPEVLERASEVIELVRAAQDPDGYLCTWVQTRPSSARRWADWRAGHETYVGGHLVQAAIAWHRALGDDRLLRVARRFADCMLRQLPAVDPLAFPPHAGAEMALVELFRTTGESRYLDEARRLLGLRGHGVAGHGLYTADHCQDDVPVLAARTIRGHAVMATYLLAGALDIAIETGDRELASVVVAQVEDMVTRKMHVTAGIGSRHHGECFGDAWELPPDRAYAETCAAAGAAMLAWRLSLATGRPTYASLTERVLYNALLVGVSLDGKTFSYSNPLLVRHPNERVGTTWGHGRRPWFDCACCPPNLMRTLACLPHLIATVSDAGLDVHQLIPCDLAVTLPGGRPVACSVTTDVPWGPGRWTLRVLVTNDEPWRLGVRVPDWAEHASARVRTHADGDPMVVQPRAELVPGETVDVERVWSVGDTLELEWETPVRFLEADPRVDALRGAIAVQRGPLVYCVEDVDRPAGSAWDAREARIDRRAARAGDPMPELAGALPIHLAVTYEPPSRRARGLYAVASEPCRPVSSGSLRAVPYFLSGNRGDGAMRVWLADATPRPTEAAT